MGIMPIFAVYKSLPHLSENKDSGGQGGPNRNILLADACRHGLPHFPDRNSFADGQQSVSQDKAVVHKHAGKKRETGIGQACAPDIVQQENISCLPGEGIDQQRPLLRLC